MKVKLWEPSGCCWCFSLRTGSLMLVTIKNLLELSSLVYTVRVLAFGDIHAQIEFICRVVPTSICIKFLARFYGEFVISWIVMDILSLILNSLFMFGICKRKPAYMIPMMTTYTIVLSLFILAGIALVGLVIHIGFGALGSILGLIFGIIYFLFTYFLMVMRAHYLEIRRCKGTDIEMVQQG